MKKYFTAILLCLHIFCYANEEKIEKQLKILVGSPVHQKSSILKEFLESLKRLDKKPHTLDFFFIDRNNTKETQELLKEFAAENSCLILQAKDNSEYICNENKHHWNLQLIQTVANFKDNMIEKAVNENYDYLFLVDSDLVLNPKTLKQLIKTNKDIISNIFWTVCRDRISYLPQVWVSDERILYKHEIHEKISQDEINKRTSDFVNSLKKPGIYEVGGLGACTLISKKALKKGMSFKKISNLSFYGEDMHFCVRAAAMGFSLFVDTHYPAYHIYRESDLAGVEKYVKNCEKSVIDLDPYLLKSRFIVKSDQQTNSISEIPLLSTWWSRPYEYKWASEFVGLHYKVLDAACGIVHPFKWYLNETCQEAWACDLDPQILDYEKIMQETNVLFENKDNVKLDLHKMIRTRLVCSSICDLPSYMPKYDRIFCISTLEHMTQEDAKKALGEFANKLQPDGLIILTVDYPIVTPEKLFEMAKSQGLVPAGDVVLGPPPDDAIINKDYSPPLYIYRCVLKHE